MSFGSDLSQEFKNFTMGKFRNEVVLFTNLLDSFTNLKKHYRKYVNKIDLIHGSKGFVDFTYYGSYITSFPKGKKITRELADMMFMIIKPREKYVRLMYLQNKKGKNSTCFNGDLFQLYLLKQRCKIDRVYDKNIIMDDLNILNGDFCSVSSYGVFYIKEDKTIDMSYYPAQYVEPMSNIGKSTKRMIKYTGKYGTTKCNHGKIESLGEENLKKFGDSLVQMKIGKPICFFDPKYSEYFVYLYRKSAVFKQYIDSDQELKKYLNNIDCKKDNVGDEMYEGNKVSIIINADL